MYRVNILIRVQGVLVYSNHVLALSYQGVNCQLDLLRFLKMYLLTAIIVSSAWFMQLEVKSNNNMSV